MADEFTTHTEDGGSVVIGVGYAPENSVPEQVKPEPWGKKYLTLEVRKAIYTAMISIGAVLVMLGAVTADQWQSVTDAADSLLGLMIMASNMVALFNVPKKE